MADDDALPAPLGEKVTAAIAQGVESTKFADGKSR